MGGSAHGRDRFTGVHGRSQAVAKSAEDYQRGGFTGHLYTSFTILPAALIRTLQIESLVVLEVRKNNQAG